MPAIQLNRNFFFILRKIYGIYPWKSKRSVTSYELRVQIHELEDQKQELQDLKHELGD